MFGNKDTIIHKKIEWIELNKKTYHSARLTI